METKVEKKEVKTKKSLFGKILTWVLGTFVGLLLVVQVTGFISARNNFGVSSFLGYQSFVVLTDSMEPELPVGNGVIVKKVDVTTLVASTTPESKDGDIITFFRSNDQLIITHRIIEVIDDGDGTLTFKCLGDNLNAQTCPTEGCTIANSDLVPEEFVMGKVISSSAALGAFSKFFSSPITTLFLVLIPLGAVFASSIVDFVKAAKMRPEEKEVAEKVLSEEELSDEEFVKIKEQEKISLIKEMEKERLRKEMEEEARKEVNPIDETKKD